MSATAVLEDAILERGGTVPDELCPVLLAHVGLELGGEAAVVGQHIIDGLGVGWRFGFNPEFIWTDLVRRRTFPGLPPFEGLLRAEVCSAVYWHAESLRQLQAVGLCTVEAEGWHWLRTLYTTRVGDVFELRQHRTKTSEAT